ncbi:MAG: glycosyltransferase family 9 protein [Planctomycetota bacterium]
MRPQPILSAERQVHDPEGRRRVLIVKLSSIGDIVFSLPALEALRRTRPDDFIAWVVEDRAAALLENHPLLDQVITLPRKEWRRLRREEGLLAAARAIWQFRMKLRSLRFDLAFDLQGNIKSGLVAWASRARRRFGFARQDCREPNWIFTHARLAPQPKGQHRIDRDLALLKQAGIKAEWSAITPPCTKNDGVTVDDWLEKHLSADEPLVVMIPGTSEWLKTKRWPVERYAELARRLQQKQKTRVVLSGGPGEESLLAQIADAAPNATLAPSKPWSLAETAYLFMRADLVLGSETGPIHLAATLKAPTLAMFGPYDPGPLFPYQHPEYAIYAAVACSPCRYRSCPRPVCMTQIGLEEVQTLAESILNAIPDPARCPAANKTVFLRR